MSRDRLVLRLRAPPGAAKALVGLAIRRGFRRFLAEEAPPADAVPSGATWSLEKSGRIHLAGDPKAPVMPLIEVSDPAALDTALAEGERAGGVVLRWHGERVIPLENALAQAGDRFPVWVEVSRIAEVPAALGSLERGADSVVVTVTSPADLDALETALESPREHALAWETVPLVHIAPAGMADRVLVDTTSLLAPEEGLLVGSQAAFLFHVPSEAEGSRYTRPRPFRVNAGAAHSYVLLADGTTRYLSELEPGDAVLVCQPEGLGRTARVGRLKIERRPMVLAQVKRGPSKPTIFLQEAETVRLSTDGGRFATSELAPGVSVWGVGLAPARHLGRAVNETVVER
jgi:3-dehydroquinate synthase II